MDPLNRKTVELSEFNKTRNAFLFHLKSSDSVAFSLMLILEYLMIRDGNTLSDKDERKVEQRQKEKRQNETTNRTKTLDDAESRPDSKSRN